MISFIVPAHNEQVCLARTLEAINESARAVGKPYEIIVVDDASTDKTAEIARQHNATVLSVNHRQIAATRNSGGRTADGDRLFFVDADTTINPRAIASAMRHMDKGAAGGGAPVYFEGAPLYAQLLLLWFNLFMRIAGICGGAFMFCTRAAFNATGGFDEKLFGAEDAAMSLALGCEGRFVVLWRHVRTSGRRMRGLRGLQLALGLFGMAFFPKSLAKRSRVKKIWYESNRDDDDKADSFAVKLLNIVSLLLTIMLVTGPIWLLPWPQKLFDGPLGKVAFVSKIIGLHIGLVLWPCAYFLVHTLLRQKRWLERVRLVVLIALCVGLGWGSTLEFFRFWRWVIVG